MPYTAQDHVDGFRRMHKDCDETTALRLLNEIDEIVLFWIPLRRSFVDLAVVAGQREYDVSELVLRVWNVQFYTSATHKQAIAETDCDTLDIDSENWRSSGNSNVPSDWYEFASQTSGQIGINPPPNQSTKTITTASNTTPIVITTEQDHGFADGSQVLISSVAGNAPANGTFYTKSTGANTFQLFSDAALTLAVVGVGAGTGGFIAGPNSPKIVLEASVRTELVLAPQPSAMPASPANKMLYRSGMSYLWSWERNYEGWESKKAEFERMLGEQAEMKMKRQARKQVEILTFRQRKNFRTCGRRRC